MNVTRAMIDRAFRILQPVPAHPCSRGEHMVGPGEVERARRRARTSGGVPATIVCATCRRPLKVDAAGRLTD